MYPVLSAVVQAGPGSSECPVLVGMSQSRHQHAAAADNADWMECNQFLVGYLQLSPAK